MGINKNFKVQNGLEVGANLIVADSSKNQVGIATTNTNYTLGVSGSIGANSLYVSGIASGKDLIFSGIGSISNVQISSGIVTASSGIVTYYGDGSELSNVGGGTVTNVIYVTKDGNDANDGKSLSTSKATIKGAAGIATEGTTIRVTSGSYTENNPIELAAQVSVVGDSLREVTVSCSNADDLFYVSNGNYIQNMSFRGAPNPGAIFAFNPNKPPFINQSPYIQNCTNFIPNSIGLRIDGKHAIGDIKSMVLDSYTQYNQGGIGVSITNEGYAQLVSLFTICNNVAVYCGSGAACDLTNSNSSFGNYGLVADGVGPNKYIGIITSTLSANTDTFRVKFNNPSLTVVGATYDNVSGIATIRVNTPHNLSIGMGVSLSGLGFTCPSVPGSGIAIYPSGAYGYVFETKTVAPGRYVDAYNLIQGNRQEIINTSYAAIVAIPGFTDPNPEKCKRDLGYIVDAVSTDVRDFTSRNTISATKTYFNLETGVLLTNGLQGEVPQTIVGFHTARDQMKLAVTNNLSYNDLTIAVDPLSCADVRTFIDNLVGIITSVINTGNLSITSLPKVSAASTVFSCNVGPSTTPGQVWQSGGSAKLNLVRPFDGQVVYLKELYYTVDRIVVSNKGSGYTSTPKVTIEPPATTTDATVKWGITAQAIANISNGSVTSIDIISNGRGYSTIPSVTIAAPNSGINTATASATLIPSYYTVKSSTPITSTGICTITLNENVPYAVGVGSEVPFFKQSRVLASGHSLEYIGSGVTISNALPSGGGIPIQENETDGRNGGLVVFTTTDQSGNFRIGDGVVINQQAGTVSGKSYTKSLFATVTPFILALGG
jgi:hypothetical protein